MRRDGGPEGAVRGRRRARRWGPWLAGVGAALLAAGFALTPPLPQDPAYHLFVDRRVLLGVPNFWNVASNGLLLVAGLAGLGAVGWGGAAGAARFGSLLGRRLHGVFFAAVALTALGSTWYHLAPDTARLLWDRLPLGLAATALPAALVAERTSLGRTGRWLLAAWVAAGPLSVVYWSLGERWGMGDLRPYALLQAGAVVGVPLLLLALRPRFSGGGYYALAAALYVAAKLCEWGEGALYGLGGWLSGHTLKHVLAAAAVAALGHMLAHRRPLAVPGSGRAAATPAGS